MRQGEWFAGRYRLVGELGRGGMGEVWRATDMNLGRDVAVKVLRRNGYDATADDRARFRREGKAAARLNHPHVAYVYHTDEHAGQPYLVMELLAGPDLGSLLKKHPNGLPIERVLEYGAQAAEGLAAAHKAGVVHRDVKPSNLILDEHRRVKVCDFGIARLSGGTAGLTDPGAVIGTLGYAAPEQLNGASAAPAADVYALGCALFTMLTGRAVFSGDTVAAIISQHLYKAPPHPSSLRSGIQPAVDAYVLTLLAKNSDDRPRSATIAAHLRGLPRVRGTGRASERTRTLPGRQGEAERFARSRNVAGIPRSPIAARPLHFFWLLDCSWSMGRGRKMDSLNFTIREALSELRIAAVNHPADTMMMRTITFSNGTSDMSKPTPVTEFTWHDVRSDARPSRSGLGEALKLVSLALATPPMPEHAGVPVLALVSDGLHMDDWRAGLRALDATPWGKRAVRVAIAIGDDADKRILKGFLADPKLEPLGANCSTQLAAAIRWPSGR